MEEGDSDGDESIVTTLPGEPEDDPITNVQQAWEVLRNASCIVGMHPDQASIGSLLSKDRQSEHQHIPLLQEGIRIVKCRDRRYAHHQAP